MTLAQVPARKLKKERAKGREKLWENAKELPFHSARGTLREAAYVVIIHVKWTRWAVNEPFRGQIDGQNRADHTQRGIDLSRAEQHGFEGFRLVASRLGSRHQDDTVIINAAEIRLDFQSARHPSETNRHRCQRTRH